MYVYVYKYISLIISDLSVCLSMSLLCLCVYTYCIYVYCVIRTCVTGCVAYAYVTMYILYILAYLAIYYVCVRKKLI